MSCRGVHFALTKQQVEKLRSFKTDPERLQYLQEELEEDFIRNDPERMAETDKAWDAMHRCLSDGKLGYDNGEFPLNHLILGGEPLYFEDDHIMSLKTPDQVRRVAASLGLVTPQLMRERYFHIDPKDYGFPLTEEDYQYTCDWFTDLIPFYQKAAREGRYVLFTAEQ